MYIKYIAKIHLFLLTTNNLLIFLHLNYIYFI